MSGSQRGERPTSPASQAGNSGFVQVCGHRLEVLDLPAARPDRPPLLLLHEGLGSVSLWRDFPAQVAAATGCRTIAYSRHGHGRSSPSPGPHEVRFMHQEALEVLPALREALGLERPLLLGHSTGASMALIHAGAKRWPLAGVVAIAPLCFVEDFNLQSIRQMQEVFRNTDLKQKMARHHDDPEAVFWSWNNIWLLPAFGAWSIEDSLAGIRCKVLAILGAGDEYSTPRQVDAIRRLAVNSAGVQVLELAECGHSPQRDQPQRVLEALVRFVDECEA